jgi:O-antigen/teichoic acid export membrane protein
MFIVPSTFILAALSKPFITIFSDVSYTSSASVFFFLMGWVTVRALARPYVAHFVSFSKTSYPLILTLIYIPLNVLFNLIFIPDSILGFKLLGLGAVGAAIATLISAIINYFLIRVLSHRLVRTGINFSVIKHLIAGGITGCLLYIIQEFVWEISRIYELIAISSIAVLLFLCLLYILGEMTRKDLRFLIGTINPKKMKDYIIGELSNRDN